MKKNNFNLSIIIPLYNSAFTVDKTIDSLCHKSLKFIDDIVIYNDGSTDHSLKIIKKLKSKNSKIRCFSSKINRGGAYARNFAIKKAKNELLKIVDADNIIDPNSLIKLYKYAIKNKFRAHYQTGKYFSENHKIIDSHFNYYKVYKKNISYQSYLKQFVPLENFLFTKKQWKIAGGYNENTHWDTQDFGVNFIKKVGDVPIVKNTFYLHRRFVKNYKSYYERQELSGENFFNSYKLFEIFFDDVDPSRLIFLLRRNVFSSENINSAIEKYKNELYPEFYYELKPLKLILKLIKYHKERKLIKSEKTIKKYLFNSKLKITDLILFLIIRCDKKFNNKNYNEFKKIKNYFNFLIIFIKYPQSFKLIFIYTKLILFSILRKIKKLLIG